VNTPAAGPCDDANPCTTPDVCDGTRSQADGGCSGTDVNSVTCTTEADCPLDPLGANYPCVNGFCFCTLTPSVNYILINSEKNPLCDGGTRSGFSCETDDDCPGGVCDQFANGGNCFDSGDNAEKITARVRIGSAGSPINGGQLLMLFDPTCLKFNDVSGVAPYTTTIYGPVVGAGSVFIAVGVDPFAGIDGPLGNTDLLQLSFTKIGECNECDLCFGSNNPQNSYLVDDAGQKVDIDAKCKTVRARGDLILETPDNIKTNVDCDKQTAVETWDAPSVSHSCGPATITCRGAHETGFVYGAGTVQNGGIMLPGSSSFCCSASETRCDQTVGCAGAAVNCPRGDDGKQIGCWTVTVNDQTSLDIDVQLMPPIVSGDADGLTRCILFTLYSDCGITEPDTFSADVTFGGLFHFNGKVQDKIKVPASGQWGCITAQDQFHTLRSCYTFDPNGGDCVDGQLQANFEGDPHFGGNWLIGGNLDGWKKDDPLSDPSVDTIDILDFGTFVSQYGICYADNDTPCGTVGPNADINGDGCVTLSDYNFVLNNFLVNSKQCCCERTSGTTVNQVTEISVEQLQQSV
jgi:hypothetical protein